MGRFSGHFYHLQIKIDENRITKKKEKKLVNTEALAVSSPKSDNPNHDSKRQERNAILLSPNFLFIVKSFEHFHQGPVGHTFEQKLC